MDQITILYLTFGILSWAYVRGTACEPAYCESHLKIRLVGALQKLDIVRKDFLLELVLNMQQTSYST